jgi:hypothetical protein
MLFGVRYAPGEPVMRALLIISFLSVSAVAGGITYTDMGVMRIIQTYVYGQSWITAEQFGLLQNGMSYEDAVRVLERPGREVSSTPVHATAGETMVVTYSWHNADDSSVLLVFMDNQLVEKARIGLVD